MKDPLTICIPRLHLLRNHGPSVLVSLHELEQPLILILCPRSLLELARSKGSITVAHLAQAPSKPVEVSLATVLVAAAGDVERDFVPVDLLAFACRSCYPLVRYIYV